MMANTAYVGVLPCCGLAASCGLNLASGRNANSFCSTRRFSTLTNRGSSFPGAQRRSPALRQRSAGHLRATRATAQLAELDLTEENIEAVLLEARVELLQLFDSTVGITGVAELADLDGPYVKLRLKGRFWHERSLVLARLGNYLQKRIPEIMEVEIEDVSQLDDSPENF